MKVAWKKVWPDIMDDIPRDFEGFQNLNRDIAQLAIKAGFHEVDENGAARITRGGTFRQRTAGVTGTTSRRFT